MIVLRRNFSVFDIQHGNFFFPAELAIGSFDWQILALLGSVWGGSIWVPVERPHLPYSGELSAPSGRFGS